MSCRRLRQNAYLSFVLLILALAAGLAHAVDKHAHEATAFDETRALKISQSAIDRVLSNHRFTDSMGRTLSLHEFRGRPLILSLIYTSCYHTCPRLTQTVARAIDVANETFGADQFHVATIGFDSAVDTPARMQLYARERGIVLANWRFLSVDEPTMKAFAQEIGFIYFSSPRGYDHLAQTTVIDADGKVYRQVYGEGFKPYQLVEPLKELIFGTQVRSLSVSNWVKGIRLFCTVYDANTERYRFDYSIFVGMLIGLLSLGAIAVFIIRNWRQGH
jgi:protein SCO1